MVSLAGGSMTTGSTSLAAGAAAASCGDRQWLQVNAPAQAARSGRAGRAESTDVVASATAIVAVEVGSALVVEGAAAACGGSRGMAARATRMHEQSSPSAMQRLMLASLGWTQKG